MRVKYLAEVFHNTGSELDGSADNPIGDSLDSLRYFAENSHFLATKSKLGALEIIYPESEIPDQLVVNEG